MNYLLFSYPNCPGCEELKKCLSETDFGGQEYNLVLKEQAEDKRFFKCYQA